MFAQDQWRLSKELGLSLIPALRFDADSRSSATTWDQDRAAVAPLPALTVRVSYGSGFRAPSFKAAAAV